MEHAEFLAHIKSNQGIIRKLVGLYVVSADDKKDLYQEILFQAWKSISSFRGEARFSTWLYRVCLNTILTYHKKHKPEVYHENLESVSPLVNNTGTDKENVEALYLAIRQLPETERAIICMHLDGYDNTEISEVMGISINHVSVKLHRSKDRLSKILKP